MPKALRALFERWRPASMSDHAPVLEAVFSTGHTNRNFLVRLAGERLVVRMPDADQARFGIDRSVEEKILTRVDSEALCAPVMYCEPSTGVLVTRYLSSRALRFDGPSAERSISRIADTLSRVHRIDIDVPAVRLVDRIRHYLRETSRCSDATRLRARRWSDACSPILEKYMLSRWRPSLCHNDLVAANILDIGPQVRLIDWEYAALGDPFFDLAAVVEEHGLAELDRELLLLAYGEPGPDAYLRLYHARVIHRLLGLLWYLVRLDCQATRSEAMDAALKRHEHALASLLKEGVDG